MSSVKHGTQMPMPMRAMCHAHAPFVCIYVSHGASLMLALLFSIGHGVHHGSARTIRGGQARLLQRVASHYLPRDRNLCARALGGWRGGATYARALLTIKATCWMVVVAQDVVCMGIAWGGVHIVAQREACTYPPNKYSINPAPPQLHPTAPHPTALR